MRRINIGGQSFEDIRSKDSFYVDKTYFIRDWWEDPSQVTLITRPRRFGKTLNMQMMECFFSCNYEGRGEELFSGLDVWNEEKYRQLQGTYPVIFLSFANVQESSLNPAVARIGRVISQTYRQYGFLQDSDKIDSFGKKQLLEFGIKIPENEIAESLNFLSEMLSRHYGKSVLIFLDEYDTPLQNAYLNGYWKEMTGFIGNLFNSTFKTNPFMERALMTGITRVSKESIFSQLNNPDVVTTTSKKYETVFGFTQEEVEAALDEYGLLDKKDEVREWYDGFRFGDRNDIYNPWSITKYLDTGVFDTHWANTSSNDLIGELVAGNTDIEKSMEILLSGGTIETEMDEEVVFVDLSDSTEAVWSLMVAAGYLKIIDVKPGTDGFSVGTYVLAITNGETRRMFAGMIRRWFGRAGSSTNSFVQGMITGDIRSMNAYMNEIAERSFSSFDVGTRPTGKEPERFYHGFVLGLLVNENERYQIRSNRESGYGRYDVCMYPRDKGVPGIVMEFKVQDDEEKDLTETADAAIAQIKEKDYAADLRSAGVTDIRQYGFAFCGKKVLIEKG